MTSNQQGGKIITIPHIQPVKYIQRSHGAIQGYAVNTYHGLVKKFNEDRVSIIMNITKPNYPGRWPKCSYFSIFDGHGGNFCSDFLKENMHRYITEDQNFPYHPIQALKAGFRKAEQQFMKIASQKQPIERSGSCAIVILIIDQMCYIANVGDSRAILSSHLGKKVYQLSKDHKPNSETQRQRIVSEGGSVYQSIVKLKNGDTMPGPFRINPGKLSVSRSFGDIQAKDEKFGGNPKVLIAKPQITYFEIKNQEHDFIFMGSDGIFDKLSNQTITNSIWDIQKKIAQQNDFAGIASSAIIQLAMKNMSFDNLTSLLIVFEDNGRFKLPKKPITAIQKLSKIVANKEDQNVKKIKDKNNPTLSPVTTQPQFKKSKSSNYLINYNSVQPNNLSKISKNPSVNKISEKLGNKRKSMHQDKTKNVEPTAFNVTLKTAKNNSKKESIWKLLNDGKNAKKVDKIRS